MAADLHIHVLEPPCEERHLRLFFRNTLGSQWGPQNLLEVVVRTAPEPSQAEQDEAWEKVAGTPSIWIGEVSWLKAAIFKDDDVFVPQPVGAVSELIGEGLTELTPTLGEALLRAVARDNTTSYEVLADKDDFKKLALFLVAHSGKQIFTVSW